jgi:hypothetical protein
MRSTHFLAWLAGGFAATAVAAGGCGSSSTGTSAAAAGGATASSTVHSSSVGVTTGPGGSGGSGGAASTNHSFATATPITIDSTTPTMATLETPTTPDFYSFSGTKGDTIVIQAIAAGLAMPATNNADGAIIDTVVTLYDSTMTQIAQDDDGWPRFDTDSTLYTVLPSTGMFYIEVQDCNGWATTQKGAACAMANGIMTFDYELAFFSAKNLLGGTPEGTNGGNLTPPTAAVATFVLPSNSTTPPYLPVTLYNQVSATTQIDAFEVDTKTDADMGNTTTGSRPRLDVFVQPSGTVNGNGSTTPPGQIWVSSTLDITGTNLGSIDGANYGEGDEIVKASNGPADLSLPITLGTKYWVFVAHAAALSTNDFYFGVTYGETFYGNQLEVEPNDTAAQANVLTVQANADKTFSYFSDGDISNSGADVDWYSFAVPGTANKFVQGSCAAVRSGAGLQGFTYGLYAADGTTPIGTPVTEGSDKDYSLAKTAIPAGTTTILLKLTATGQDPVNLGMSYRCGVTLSPT